MEYIEKVREKIKDLFVTKLTSEQRDAEIDIIIRDVYSAGFSWAKETVSNWYEPEGLMS